MSRSLCVIVPSLNPIKYNLFLRDSVDEDCLPDIETDILNVSESFTGYFHGNQRH